MACPALAEYTRSLTQLGTRSKNRRVSLIGGVVLAGAVIDVHDVGLIALTLAKTGACRPIPIVG